MSEQLNVELAIPETLNPQGVRVRVSGTQDQPLFCLADVCAVLAIKNVGDVASRLDDDEKSYIGRTDVGLSPGRDVVYVTEAGLYTVLLRSDKPQAKPFRKWVCGEVLPTIRRCGSYPATTELVRASPLLALRDMVEHLIAQDREIAAIHARQETLAAEIADAHLLASAAIDCQTSNHGYYSILAFARLSCCEVTLVEAASLGLRATRICRERGVRVGKVRDPRFGTVNTYPESVLSEIWS